jgi:threonine dehydrogenase-like Zn-dependent dehydrogenase
MSKLDAYRAGTQPVPQRMLKWHFYGDGYDSLKVEEVDVPQPGPYELLVRQDANGLCFSDTKVIALGAGHPRMVGRDLSVDPATLGHEVAITVVQVGADLAGKFSVGQRFIVQADVFYKGVSMAYGYAISGGLSQYSIIPQAMIDGDEGCYLLPISDETCYAETALVEPWACVVGAYNQGHRAGIKAGGRLLVLAGPGAGGEVWDGAAPEGPAGSAVVVGDYAAALPLADGAPCKGVASVEDWAALKAAETGAAGFDDILVLGAPEPEAIEGAASTLANHGMLSFVGPHAVARKLTIDIGRIHYNWHHYMGTSSLEAAAAYAEPRGADLLAGGMAWFIGAAGPMGQMHVQRAVMHANPPSLIVGTDIDDGRLATLVDRLSGEAKKRGVRLVTINPKGMSPEEFNLELKRLTGGKGFDDIISLVPVPALIEHSIDFLGDNAWCNVFAGVARGTMAQLDADAIRNRGVRFIGSSGSSIADMRQTLAMVEAKELNTNASLAAIGGMKTAQEGLLGVKNGRFPGKTLVFPLIEEMPLMSLAELKEAYPTVYAKMQDGKFWTKAAEEELFTLTVAAE